MTNTGETTLVPVRHPPLPRNSPHSNGMGASDAKGYRRADFEDAWARYLWDLPFGGH